MPVAIVTGSGGLIGSESVAYLVEQGFDVVGLENDMRAQFFGPDASTASSTHRLTERFPDFHSVDMDIRDREGVEARFARHGSDIEIIIHTAAQPSHDWAAGDPHTDFEVNALGTMILLEATRQYRPEAAFVFMSTNKVYGDLPNRKPLVELPTRHDYADPNDYEGITEACGLDQTLHSVFGASKAAADLMAQEYGRYFGLNVGVFG